MADAAYIILCQDSLAYSSVNNQIRISNAYLNSGQFTIDDDVIRSQGIHQLDGYAVVPGTEDFFPDFFVPDNYKTAPPPRIVLKEPTSKL